MTAPRYAVGIDLGTTNSAVAYVDLLSEREGRDSSFVFEVDQEVSLGVRSELPVLPSALVVAPDGNVESVGRRALDTSAKSPDSVVLSAKSWLAHGGINREANILPWQSQAVPQDHRLSPIQAGAAVLEHIRTAWNAKIAEFEPAYRLENQFVTITVPASFDETAQHLTIEAAKRAGLHGSLRLLEEPQAAFYRWLEGQKDLLQTDETILVVDVGGGTTDFSIFDFKIEAGAPKVIRRSVSEHILLGGDNIDRAIANAVEQKLSAEKSVSLTSWQHSVLVQQARILKEKILTSSTIGDEVFKISLPVQGGSLFETSLVAQISAKEIYQIVIEGFYPFVPSNEVPQRAQGGLREIGLPYARDSRITAHLAGFLRNERVSAILFNGGSLASAGLRERIVDCITQWQSGERPRILDATEFDLAVARGAAWYGAKIVSGQSATITGGHPRSVYIELYRRKATEPRRGVCIVPKGFSDLSTVSVPGEGFSLLTGKLARFQLWQSLTRPNDLIGDVVEMDDVEFHELSPVSTKLDVPSGRIKTSDGAIAVRPAVRLLDTGLLGLTFFEINPPGGVEPLEFNLEFNVRKEQRDQDPAEGFGSETGTVDRAMLQQATEVVDVYYGKGRADRDSGNPKHLIRELEQITRLSKANWSLDFLRSLWPAIARGIGRRGRSPRHEEVWCIVAGWLLRPGYGAPGDESRIQEVWKAWSAGLAFPKEPANRTQWWILWRRIAAGLSPDQQLNIYEAATRARAQAPTGERSEITRLIGSLERIPLDQKRNFINVLSGEIESAKAVFDPSIPWALGRLSARIPLYGGIDAVLPPSAIALWIRKVLEAPSTLPAFRRALIMAARRTSERSLNVDDALLADVTKRLRGLNVAPEDLAMLSTPGEFAEEDVRFWSGDELPSGLRLR